MRMQQLTQKARQAAGALALLGLEEKNQALRAIRAALLASADAIEAANQADLARSQAEGLAAPLQKRLKFDSKKIAEVISGLDSLLGLPDPVGRTLLATQLDDGLDLYRVSCPIGVIGLIFESRPDALVQISTLALKSGNAVLLKGGSEALETNRVLARVIGEAAASAGMPDGWITLLETRLDVRELLDQDETVDLLIPRGTNEFVRMIMDNTRIPVMGHADGVCHLYLDAAADRQMAIRLAVDSKTQYVAVCNAAETILVHRSLAGDFLDELAGALKSAGVILLGCAETCARLGCELAGSWHTEYLDYTAAIKIVDSLDDAIEHINRYGSHHTDAIVTADQAAASRFLRAVDSGNVFWNCSTRFSDGYRYGFGAEVGSSTSKLHARGPVGLDGLVTYQYRLLG
ncbi:MAG: glutamate-5-semialdehyde dehydrogenase, partial [Clostridiaceae bacterium]|nr:glutamate-5-semialdehyde dehydrogenase [Clostridiaceae bacterium]